MNIPPDANCLHTILHGMLTLDTGRRERAEALQRFAASTGLAPEEAAAIAASAPSFPPGFLDPFIARFCDEAMRTMLPERVELMCQGGDKGRMFALLEFFAWLDEHAVELKLALKGLAKAAGETLDEVEILLDALVAAAEERLHGQD